MKHLIKDSECHCLERIPGTRNKSKPHRQFSECFPDCIWMDTKHVSTCDLISGVQNAYSLLLIGSDYKFVLCEIVFKIFYLFHIKIISQFENFTIKINATFKDTVTEHSRWRNLNSLYGELSGS